MPFRDVDAMAFQVHLLRILLRVGSVLLCSAFLTMLLPVDWMAESHRWLGLGEFPRTPLVDYLTRSVAALYGFHGVLLWLVSNDPIRYRSIALFCSLQNVTFGSMMIAIDVHAGMPMFWTLSEGPFIVGMGIILFVLARKLPK